MKYIKILSTNAEFQSLFPTATLLEINAENKEIVKLKIESEGIKINIFHYKDFEIFTKIQNTKNPINIESIYLNPENDLIIICDRKLWYELYLPLLRNFPEDFKKLEDLYVKKNVTVFFNFAILEAVNYEVESEFFYDFKFNHIAISDYEIFKNKKNFYYDSFYSLYHLMAEGQIYSFTNKNRFRGPNEYFINFKDIFECLDITNSVNRTALYNHTCLKPRYHRIKFLLEANNAKILNLGRNNVNIKFIDEYKKATDEGMIRTDNGKNFSENHLKYFNKDLYTEFLNIQNKITITPDEPNFLYDHLKNYFEKKEYNEAYIEIVGETHCIFKLQYGFFTEKSLKPILSNNFCMIYGSQKVYKEYKRIGIELFLDDLKINGIEDVDELKQIEIIINALKSFDKNQIKNLYLNRYKDLENNKKILINHYCNIMNNVNKLLIKTKLL